MGRIGWNAPAAALYQQAVASGEAEVAEGGALVVSTGSHTGRSPADKFVVRDALTEETIWWDNNRPMSRSHFEALREDIMAHARLKNLHVQDLHGGADPAYRLPTRVICEYAWHALFIQHLLILPEARLGFRPALTIVDLPSFKADPARHGTRSETVIAIDFSAGLVLIGGTQYAGEMKKSVFTIMNYALPLANVMSMHCSANVGAKGDVALFFGLSGTGKTTLSTDAARKLIGDDEHGWSDNGVFNFEGGCYAKVIKLSPTAEPEIYQTTRTFGTVLENVVIDPLTRVQNLDDDSKTENTRGCYPLTQIENAEMSGMAGHPQNVIFLTADAFGVMPPVSKLTPEQAMYHFLSGYTAKLAGTERGVKEPQATFSTCFGAPFMALQPSVYANLLKEKLNKHKAQCWLVNTGWGGGPFGVGKRISIAHTRAIIRAILDGKLKDVATKPDPVFGLNIPESCDGVPKEILTPRNTWVNPEEYDMKAKDLASRFAKNFETFAPTVSKEVVAAGPRV